MRAFWSDSQNCSHNVSQKVKGAFNSASCRVECPSPARESKWQSEKVSHKMLLVLLSSSA